MSKPFAAISVQQLKKAIVIREEIELLEAELNAIIDFSTNDSARTATKSRRTMSAAGRRAIAAGQKARWAKIKRTGTMPRTTTRRKMPAAAKVKLAAIARARWAKAKAAGRSAL